MKFLQYRPSQEIPRPVAILTLLRLAIKVLLFFSAVHFNASPYALTVLLYILIVMEIYKNLGTVLIAKGASRFVVGSLISALDGGLIILALYFTNLLESDLYLFILLSCAFNATEYGLESAFAEGFTAGFAYAIIGIVIGVPVTLIITRFPFILLLGLVSGWLSSELKETEGTLQVVVEEDKQEKKLNQVKNDFIGIASHNLRTPLTALRGYIYILLNKRVGDVNDKQAELLQSMDRNVSTMMVLVDDLLRIISLESSKLLLNKQRINVKEYFDLIIPDIEVVAKLNNVTLGYVNTINPSMNVVIDKERMKIAIENIADNAVKYAQHKVDIRVLANAAELIVEIQDDGKGMSKVEVANLFKKFKVSQEHDPQETISRSSGLALYISKIIILAHKGSITVKSEEGKGSLFKISIATG